MASARPVRDSDTALWLHNKLGSIEELWVSSSIGGIIKTDTIDNILRCFPVLTTTVKMKLLLGILHLPRRSLEEMKHTIDGVVELALEDIDQWVRLVANIVKTYPMTCKLNLDLNSNPIAANVIQQLKEKVLDSDTFATLPLECQYVNKNALQNLVGNQPPPRRHFALKRKPKSAALRVDLMQKSTDASSQVKRGAAGNKTVPVKHRDMTRKFSDDASPMRGIPKTPGGPHRHEGFRNQGISNSQTPGSSGFSRSTSRYSGRVERGTKLLDISEQPIGIKEAKRRKKQQLEEEASHNPLPEEKEDETPEYAAGLVPSTMTAQASLPEDNMEPGKDVGNKDEEEEMDADHDEEEETHPGFQPSGIVEKAPPQYTPPQYTLPGNSEPLSTSPNKKKRPRKSSSSYERRPSLDELPIYAMPATPSPFFKPTNPQTPQRPSEDLHHTSPHRSNEIHNQMLPPAPVSLTPNSNPILRSPTNTQPSDLSTKAPAQAQVIVRPSSSRSAAGQTSANIVTGGQQPSEGPGSQSSQRNIHHNPNFYASSAAPSSQQNLVQSPQKVLTQSLPNMLPAYASSVYQTQQVRGLSPAPPYLIPQNLIQQQHQLQQVPTVIQMPATPGLIPVQRHSSAPTNPQPQVTVRPMYQQLPQHQQQPQQAAQTQQAAPKKALTLTRDQMFQAQEMFKAANRLSRAEKAIILGFMAGSRENPTPDKGDVVQILLSEHEQTIHNPAGGGIIPVVVETLFEMNYRTGVSSKKQRIKQVAGSVHGRVQVH